MGNIDGFGHGSLDKGKDQACSAEQAACRTQIKEQLGKFSDQEFGRYLGAIKSVIVASKDSNYINPKTGKPLNENVKKNIVAIEEAYNKLQTLNPSDVEDFHKRFNDIVYKSGLKDDKGRNFLAEFLDPDGDGHAGMRGYKNGFGPDMGLHGVKIGNEEASTNTMEPGLPSKKSHERSPDSFSVLEQLDIKIWGKTLTPEEAKSEYSKMLNDPKYHKEIYDRAKNFFGNTKDPIESTLLEGLEPTDINRQRMKMLLSGLDTKNHSDVGLSENANLNLRENEFDKKITDESVIKVNDLLMGKKYELGNWKNYNKDIAKALGLPVGKEQEGIMALQKYLGVEADGKFGPKTRAALFRKQKVEITKISENPKFKKEEAQITKRSYLGGEKELKTLKSGLPKGTFSSIPSSKLMSYRRDLNKNHIDLTADTFRGLKGLEFKNSNTGENVKLSDILKGKNPEITLFSTITGDFNNPKKHRVMIKSGNDLYEFKVKDETLLKLLGKNK